ncbi:MAG: transposase [Candidatus Omnitrophota bacterium]
MKSIKFENNCFYHVYNRGADKREIFIDEEDYVRFIHSLYEFNDFNFALPFSQVYKKERRRPRELLVDILCFCLMPNHFHLILTQRMENGITKFMRKLGTGYTMYFNNKYQRTGVLFQGKFKAILIETDEYLLHLSRYIHLNPVEIIQPDWKEKGIKDLDKVKEFLENYRWSSLLDYLGKKNFSSVIGKKDFILEFFKEIQDYRKFLYSFSIEEMDKLKEIKVE